MAQNDRNPWTPEEDNRVRTLLGAGQSIAFVAADLKRSESAVKGRAYVLRISLKRVKMKPRAKGMLDLFVEFVALVAHENPLEPPPRQPSLAA